MRLERILDIKKLNDKISSGYVSARRHPHSPIVVYSYTQKTVNENAWDEITMHCRDLVVDYQGNIIANCFKFAGPPPKARISVFWYDIRPYVVSGGSFENEKVYRAKKIIFEEQPELKDAFRILCSDSVTAICEMNGEIALVGTIANFELADGTQLWTPAMDLAWPGPKVHGRP